MLNLLRKGTSVLFKIATYLLVLLSVSFCAKAQTLTVTTDRHQILIGEQLVYEVRLNNLVYGQHQVVQWVNVPDTFSSFELVKTEKIDTIKVGTNISMYQRFTLTSFDSGHWQIPSMQVFVTDGNYRKAIHTDTIGIDVLPVDVTGLIDYHDIKPIIEVPNGIDYRKYVIGGLITFALLIVAYLLLKKKRMVKEKQVAVTKENAYDWAKKQLTKLEKEKDDYGVVAYFTRLDEIYRTYLLKRDMSRALHATSGELMITITKKLHNEKVKTSFFQFMRMADAVKFAKYPANLEEKRAAFGITSLFVEQMERER